MFPFLLTSCLKVAVQPCMELIPIKKMSSWLSTMTGLEGRNFGFRKVLDCRKRHFLGVNNKWIPHVYEIISHQMKKTLQSANHFQNFLPMLAKIYFQCLANLSKLIDFCSTWNCQEILISWWFFRGILVSLIVQFCLVAEENIGDNPLHDCRCF